MKLFFATLAVVLLAGCLQTAPVQKRLTEADDPFGDCFSALESDPKLAVLIPKIGAIARPDRATIEQMASKEKPTSEAKQAISAWGVSRQYCHDLGRQFRAANAPLGFGAAYDSAQSALLENIANLYGENITYGQFISERLRLAKISMAEMDDINNRDGVARQQRAREDSARAGMALQNMIQQQQAQQQLQLQEQQILQQNRPINTTCNRYGTITNCTTR